MVAILGAGYSVVMNGAAADNHRRARSASVAPERTQGSGGFLARIDDYQQRHGWLALPFAVFRKFGDDQAGNLAALIAYYAFFSIFPLLLALTTILGYVLAGDPALEQRVFSTALGQFPIIGQHDATQPLTGNPAGLVIGLVLALWSGLGVAQMAQQAFNRIHGVPRADWPAFLPRLLRSLEVVIIGGLGLIVTTLTALFTYLFRRLTIRSLGWREVIVGAAIAAVAWFVLQKIGTSLVNREVRGATRTYGTFAVVIGLLFWFYLLSQITLYCAELNIVLTQRLWPRSLRSLIEARADSAADRRAYRSYPSWKDKSTTCVCTLT